MSLKTTDVLRLLVLAAIWGGSFIFMRVIVPALGPVWTAGLRLAIGGAALLAYIRFIRFAPGWRQHFRHYAVMGVMNSAVPFLLYAYAALHLPAALSAILNSTAPLFGTIFAALWLGDSLSVLGGMGLVLGTAGVALANWRPGVTVADGSGPAMLACLAAAACYGLSGTYLKKFARHVPSLGMAGCSQVVAGAALLLFTPLVPLPVAATPLVAGCLLGLALLCSGLAYVLYFRLVADVGPARALTVTYLVPVFGILWGVLFLGERITLPMVAGCGVILLGTTLVVSPKPAAKAA